ncbi:MAG: deoxyribose-phosphate aldolase [Oscillospiraceae bacterium]|nr:deoxyribose-phosphate aldolase [Oscillospiraceae bacterium]
MTDQEILSHIDHTLLRADAAAGEIDKLCAEALEYKTASVCIPASYVAYARGKFPGLNICTVIGFPLGYSTTAVKCFEARDAIQNGADEIDMVINLGWVKDGKFPEVQREIADVKAACGDKILKVIIETCYLTQEEKIALCGCVTAAGADYIKTSTGFGSAGADIEDIRLFKKHIGENVRIKAAGGIRTREDMERFLSEGCDRIGTSAARLLMN